MRILLLEFGPVMPAPTTCAPSTTWNSAATIRKDTPSEMTVALAGVSARNRVISSLGKMYMSVAMTAMNPMPRANAVQPESAIPYGSRRP